MSDGQVTHSESGEWLASGGELSTLIRETIELAQEQRRILELIAKGESVRRCLEEICLGIERIDPRVRVCVLVAGEGRTCFSDVIAPRFPQFSEAIRNAPIGDGRGGTCAQLLVAGEPVTAADIATDGRWRDDWKALCLALGIKAGHSAPVAGTNALPRASVFLCFDRPKEPSAWDLRLAENAASLVGILRRRDQAEQALRLSAAQLEAELADSKLLQELSTELIDEQDVQALYEKIMDAAVGIMHSQFASMQVLNGERGKGGRLRLQASRGFSADAQKLWEWVAEETPSSCGAVLRSGQRSLVPDVEACDFVDRKAYLDAGIHSMQSTPLVSRSGKLLGMISTHWDKPHQPSERDLRMLDLLSRQAADLIERKENEEALSQQRRTYEAVLNTTPDLAYIFDLNHRFIYANDGLLKMWGKSWDEAVGKTCLELGYEPWHAEMHDGEIDQVVATKKPVRGTVPFTGTFGRRIYDYILTPVFDAEGNVEAVAGTTRDVTDMLAAEDAVRERDERLQMALAACAVATWQWDMQQDRLTGDSRMAFLFNRDPQAVSQGLPRSELVQAIHADDVARVNEALKHAIAKREPYRIQYRVHAADGQVHWVSIRGQVHHDETGQPVRVAGAITEITEQKRAEEELARSQQTFVTLVERAPFGMYVVDEDFRIAVMNEGSQTGAFANVRPVIGRDFAEAMRILWPEDVAAGIIGHFRRTLETGEPYYSRDFFNPRSDIDKAEAYEWELHRIKLPDARYGVVCYYYDSTELRQAEHALRESEARFRNMADNAPVMVWVTEADASCSYLSKSWYEFTGQTPETGLGFGWLDAAHPDDREAARDMFVAANEKGEPFRLEYRLRRGDGVYRWAIDAAQPRFGPDGDFLGYIGSVIDITERKEAEETQQLLVAELQHRVKNMLASVQAIMQHTLRGSRNPEDFAQSFSGRIQSMARVHSLLTSGAWQGAELGDVIRDQLVLGAVEEARLTAQGPAVRLEPQLAMHLALMLHELGTNSRKYGALARPEGQVAVKWSVEGAILRLKWTERGGPAVAAPLRRGFGTRLIEQNARGEGGYARMAVEDEGVAWDIAVPLPHQNVSIVRRDAPQGKTDGGATPRTVAGGKESSAPLAGKRFLVVEDEPLIALDLIAALEDVGAQIAGPAGTLEEALALIGGKPFDAALLDGNLHGRRVDEVAAALTRAGVPFLFVTGYGRESLPPAFGKTAMLSKPFSQHELVEAASRLVAAREPAVRLKH